MRPQEWFDKDQFWEDFYPSMFPASRFEEARQQVGQVLGFVPALANGASVLDLCCGPGRFSVPLAERGYRVTAVDRTAFLLRKGEEYARETNANVEWILSDMRDFVRPASFDLALSMYTSFGYFDNPDEDLTVLENLHSSLSPGGTLVLDVFGKEVLARVYQPASYDILEDGTRLVCRREVYDDWTRVRNEWSIIREDRAVHYPFHHTIYSGYELKTLLRRAGFTEVRLFGTFDQQPYDLSAARLIAVARRG